MKMRVADMENLFVSCFYRIETFDELKPFFFRLFTRLVTAISFFILITPAVGDVGNQFVKINLAYGASIDIPRSWQIRRGNEMLAIETSVGAAIDLSGYSKQVAGTEALLVAGFPHARLYAGATVTSIEIRGSSHSSATTLSEEQLRSSVLTIRNGLDATLAQMGGKTWGWTPLKLVALGKTKALLISYKRSSDAGDRQVHVYKFFCTERVYNVALSTSVNGEGVNNIVLKRIAESFSAP